MAMGPSCDLEDETPVGNTPLVRLKRVRSSGSRAEIHAKCEWMNPAGSVKDRPALWMIRDAEKRGLLEGPSRSILDSTSGNTGIALAQIAAARGHRVTLCMPENASPARKRLLVLLGAELVLTDAQEGPDGARDVAARMAEDDPERYVYPRSVQQPDELALPLREHVARDLGADGRPDHALRRDHGHERDVHRRQPQADRAESRRSPDRRPARCGLSRDRGDETLRVHRRAADLRREHS
jgi:hypothetical protein